VADDSNDRGASPPQQPRRRPRQARSHAIVEAIYDACERILVSEGPAALNTNRIAEVAGVNVASVYRYFPNKEAIVAELYERHLAAYAELLDGLYGRADEIDAFTLEETMSFLVDAVADLHLRLLGLDADFYRKNEDRFDLAARFWPRGERRWIEQVTSWIREVLERHAARLRVEDLDRASFLVARTVTSVFRAAVRDAPHHVTSPGFRDDVIAMLLGLLVRPNAS